MVAPAIVHKPKMPKRQRGKYKWVLQGDNADNPKEVFHLPYLWHKIPIEKTGVLDCHSGEVPFGVTINTPSKDTTSQNIMFTDQSPAFDYVVDSQPDPTYMAADKTDATLGEFFSRPLKIASYEWATDQILFEKFNPWELFWENPRVNNRISNFSLLRAKMKIKVLINGNGFHYGRAILSYNPLPSTDSFTVDRGFFSEDIVAASQRPHIYLDPTHSQGGALTLPFFWYKNYLSIPSGEWSEMGDMVLQSLQPLKHANGATDRVTVTIMAWAEDTMLSMPTETNANSISPQCGEEPLCPQTGGDEYGTGPVSKPASVVERAMGALTSAPVIGPYAKATQIAAGAIAAIASTFGYARPVDVDKVSSYKPTYLGNMSNVNTIDTSNTLATDVKQEVTVDPRTVGLGSADEMVISSVAQRESYLTQFDWLIANSTEDRLFSIVVDPGVHAVLDSGLLANELHLPACAYVAQPFKYWRGTMKYRFQVVASAYHKGRLKIVYDPYSSVLGNAEYNTAYTKIIDIAENKDFTIDIGWGSSDAYREHYVPGIPQNSMFSTNPLGPGWDPTGEIGNGILSVYVVNELTTPNSDVTNDIKINVFMCASDDFEVACPEYKYLETTSYLRPPAAPATILRGEDRDEDAKKHDSRRKIHLSPQSAEEPLKGDNENTLESSRPMQDQAVAGDTIAVKQSTSDNAADVFFGEAIVSIRSILKRYCKLDSFLIPEVFEPLDTIHWESTRFWFPFYRGYNTDGFYTFPEGNFDIARMTLLNYFTPAFAGMRGGMRWKTHVWGSLSDTGNANFFQRMNRLNTYVARNEQVQIIDTSNFVQAAVDLDNYSLSGANGQVVQPVKQNPVLEAQIPYYSRFRFIPAKISNWNSPPGNEANFDVYPQLRWDTYFDSGQSDLVVRDSYCAAADDFSLFFFTGAPILYRYSNPAVPPL